MSGQQSLCTAMASLQQKIGNLFVLNSYIDKLYIKCSDFPKKLNDTITTSNFYLGFNENNKNVRNLIHGIFNFSRVPYYETVDFGLGWNFFYSNHFLHGVVWCIFSGCILRVSII